MKILLGLGFNAIHILKDLKVLGVLEFAILLTEQKRYHLTRLHARTNDVSIFIPTVRTFFWPLERWKRKENFIVK